MDVYRSLDVPFQPNSAVAPKTSRKSLLKRLPAFSLALLGTVAVTTMVVLIVTNSQAEVVTVYQGDEQVESASADQQSALQEWMSVAMLKKTHYTEVYPAFFIADQQFSTRGIQTFIPTMLEALEDYIKEISARGEIDSTTLPVLLMPEFFWRPVRNELLTHAGAEKLLNDLASLSAKYPRWLMFPGTIPTSVHTSFSSTGHKNPYVNTAPVIAEGRVLGMVSKSYESHIDQPGTVYEKGLVQRVPFNLRSGLIYSTTQSRFSYGGIPFNVEICLDHAYGTALNNEFTFCALRGPSAITLSAFQILLSASIEFQRDCRCATYVLHADTRISGVHTAYSSQTLTLWTTRERFPNTWNLIERMRKAVVGYTKESGKLPVQVYELGPDAASCKLPTRPRAM